MIWPAHASTLAQIQIGTMPQRRKRRGTPGHRGLPADYQHPWAYGPGVGFAHAMYGPRPAADDSDSSYDDSYSRSEDERTLGRVAWGLAQHPNGLQFLVWGC